MTRLRLRIRYTAWPRSALELTDTPRPTCPHCRGEGGWSEDYAGPDGEYGGTHEISCDCWDSARSWLLLPIPRWLSRIRLAKTSADPWGSFSDESPF